jgi:hypothetical protein
MNIPQKITELIDENIEFNNEILNLKKKMQEVSIKIGKELLKSDDKFKTYYEDVCSTFEKYGKNGMFSNYLDNELEKHLDDLTRKLKMGYYEIVANMLKEKFEYDFKFSLWTDGKGFGDLTFFRPFSETSVFWNGSGWTKNIYHTNIDEEDSNNKDSNEEDSNNEDSNNEDSNNEDSNNEDSNNKNSNDENSNDENSNDENSNDDS